MPVTIPPASRIRAFVGSCLIIALSILEILQPGCQEQSLPPPATPHSKWRVFYKSDTTLLDNKINAITVASDGTVWVSTDPGASYYRHGSWGSILDSLYGYRVNSIVEAKDRSIWFCLSGGGVVRYNPFSQTTVFRRFTEPDLIYDVVLSGAADRSGRTQFGELWFATVFGISRFIQTTNEQGRWLKYSQNDSGEHIPEFPTNSFRVAATKLDDNSVWFGAEKGGAVFVSYGLANLQWSVLHLRFGDPRVISLGFDLSQNVWIGRDAGGISRLDFSSYTWTEYNNRTTNGIVPDGKVNAIITDYAHTRWFGTDSGLVRLNDAGWIKFTTMNSQLPSDTVTALSYDVRGNLWIGTANGIGVYNDGGTDL